MCWKKVWSFVTLFIVHGTARVASFQTLFLECFHGNLDRRVTVRQRLKTHNPWMRGFNSRHHHKYNVRNQGNERRFLVTKENSEGDDDTINFENILDMDILLFKRRFDGDDNNNDAVELGAMQEDGTVAPLSAWSLEPTGTDDSIEFLVDEEDRFPGLIAEDVRIISIVDDTLISYGSRQVGGGKGPGNPHGEESELLYYVDRDFLEQQNIKISIKPDLEILW